MKFKLEDKIYKLPKRKYIFILFLLTECFHPAYSQVADKVEKVDRYDFTPPILSTSDVPFLSTDFLFRKSPESPFGLTFCSWISLSYCRRPTVLFSLLNKDLNKWEISFGILPNTLLLRINASNLIVDSDTLYYLPLALNYFCLTISPTSLIIFHNGNIIHSIMYIGNELTGKNLVVFAGGGEQWPELVLKTDGSTFVNKNLFYPDNIPNGAFAGTMIDPVLWNTDITKIEIDQLLGCASIIQIPLKTTWALNGANLTKSKNDKTSTCTIQRKFDYLFFSKALPFKENSVACKKLQLSLVTPSENAEISQFRRDAKQFEKFCSSGNSLTWLRLGSPSLETKFESSDSCDALTSDGQEKISCQENLCSGCQLELKQKVFVLRGICHIEEIDLSFVISKSSRELGFYFHGLERFSISETENSWVLIDSVSDIIVASTKSTIVPIGLREWTLHKELCDKPENSTLKALLSSCNSDEAVCSDGSCIPLSKRCDTYSNCFDGSDEMSCQSALKSDFYDFTSPPLPKTVVQVNIDVVRILSTPPQKPFTLIFETNFEWSDSRVNLSNIDTTINYRLRNVKLWRPKLSLVALGNPSARSGHEQLSLGKTFDFSDSEGSAIIATTFSKPILDRRDTLYKDAIYAGENTTLSFKLLTSQEVDCEFDFMFFPFDEQLCHFSLVVSTWPSSRLTLKNPISGRYTGPVKLPHYTVVHTMVERRNVKIDGTMHDGLEIIFHLKHRNSALAITVYLPTFILLILNTCTLWMMGFQGTIARILLSCIILIVIMMIWILLANYTPETGYLMACDAWMCFCSVYSIMHIAVHILLDIFSDENQPDPFSRMSSRVSSSRTSRIREVKPTDNSSLYDGILLKVTQMETAKLWSMPYWILFIARVVLPVLLLFFNGAYWPFVLYFSKLQIS